jgi:hypothetical protein
MATATEFKHKLDPSPMNPNFEGFYLPHLYPGKATHSWSLYKYGDCWAFNHWQTQKHDEGLLNGSEKCLDQHYFNLTGATPTWDSMMLCTLSTDLAFFGDHKPTTKLTYLKPWESNPTASWYLDEALGGDFMWWLCPFWAQLFPDKQPPKECWALFTPQE